MTKKFFAGWLVVLGLVISGAATAQTAPFTQIVVFGDSQADSGNLFAAKGGTDPDPGLYFDSMFMPTGTFSNGKVFPEMMAEAWGIPMVNVAYGGALTGITVDRNGIDPLFGAAMQFADTGSVYGASPFPGILAQIAGYAAQVQAGLIAPDPAALYIVIGMPNDLLVMNPDAPAAFQQALVSWAVSRGIAPPAGAADVPRFQQDLAVHIINTGLTNLTSAVPLTFLDTPFTQPQKVTIPAGAIPLLYGIGARNIAVFNFPEIRFAPLASALGPVLTETFGQIGDNYNRFLAAALGSLQSSASLPGINIIQMNLQAIDREIAANPAAFGLSNTTEACLITQCFTDPMNGPDTYRYWDTIHATTKTHEIYADRTMAAAEASLTPPQPVAVPVTIAADSGGSGAMGPLAGLMILMLLGLARRRPMIH